MSILSSSSEATLAWAKDFSQELKLGDIVALQGPLGSGKTQVAKGLIWGLQGREALEVTSPTFTLVEEYPGNPRIYHADLYRIENPQALMDLAWDEIAGSTSIALIEWPERAALLSLKFSYQIEIEIAGKNLRRISVKKISHGPKKD